MLKLTELAQRLDFQIGDLTVSPARRLLEGPGGTRHLEPRVMMVFLFLLEREGHVVTRAELFDECWAGAPVGDDSLNRVIAGIRQHAEAVATRSFTIETVPRTGYIFTVLRCDADEAVPNQPAPSLEEAVERAYDCWRMGLPQPDWGEIAQLRSALGGSRRDARAWGILALLLRKGAEYAGAAECADLVRECEAAARRALAIAPSEANARVALAGLVPLYGNWTGVREQLLAIIVDHPGNVPARHDLAMLEMATGRPSAAVPILEALLEQDRFAPILRYKRMYHLWSLGRIADLDRIAAENLQLWPRHPAIWSAHFWTLVFTGRAAQALRFAHDETHLHGIPAPVLGFLRRTAQVLAAKHDGTDDRGAVGSHVREALETAGRGPAQAIAGIHALLALDAVDETFEAAYGYYLGRGTGASPMRRNDADPPITDQHRRLTQPLFVPEGRKLHFDPRFLPLCEDIGLVAYWDRFELTPDFLARRP